VPYESFRAKDGYVNIGATNQKQWVNLCTALGFPQLASEARFSTPKDRLANYDELRTLIDDAVSKMTRDEAMQRLMEFDIAVGPVNTVAEILADPQIHAREMVAELTHPEYGPFRFLGVPIKMSDTPGTLRTAPPRFGEHNRAILLDLGLADSAITALADAKVIHAASASTPPAART
jgi:crotonobetainyl-CoA:carnitine CoA-transferase CaiB-like acyl-CoA transferase